LKNIRYSIINKTSIHELLNLRNIYTDNSINEIMSHEQFINAFYNVLNKNKLKFDHKIDKINFDCFVDMCLYQE